MRFSQSDTSDKNNVALIFNELQTEQIFDLSLIDFFGSGPIELIQCLNDREPCHPDTPLDGSVLT